MSRPRLEKARIRSAAKGVAPSRITTAVQDPIAIRGARRSARASIRSPICAAVSSVSTWSGLPGSVMARLLLDGLGLRILDRVLGAGRRGGWGGAGLRLVLAF